jgi:dihydrofolate reductase
VTNLIWAQARDGVIGASGTMPWHIPEDGAHFRELTTGGTVIMGRRTWDSLPERFRPLPDRRNIVVSRQSDLALSGAEVVTSLDAGLERARAAGSERIWVIGGGQLYAQAIDRADRLEITEIDIGIEGDTRAPVIDPAEWARDGADPVSGWHISSKGPRYRFLSYARLQPGD